MNLYRIIASILLMPASICLAIDLQPNDIVAPLPGKSHAMISYVNAESGTYYRNGSAVSSRPFGSPDIGIQTAIARPLAELACNTDAIQKSKMAL
jgi:hypothetical protein